MFKSQLYRHIRMEREIFFILVHNSSSLRPIGALSLVLLLVFYGSVKAVGERSEGPKTGWFSGHSLPTFTCSMKNYPLYTIAKGNGEGSGESTCAVVVEKTMWQTGVRGIFVNNRITNFFRKKIGTMCAKPKRARGKVEVWCRGSLTNGATELKIIILSSYFITS